MPRKRRRPTLTSVLSDHPPHLRRLLGSDCTWDDEATADLWTRYIANPSPADEAKLMDHYMPSLAACVMAVVGGNSRGFADPLDDYLSDGMLGLLQFIRRNKFYKPRLTGWCVRRAISKAVWTESRMRSWAGTVPNRHARSS